MNESQSSDCFPEDESSYMSPILMKSLTYESLRDNTKKALSAEARKELLKPTFPTYFTKLLEDCSVCVNQSINLITELLSSTVCMEKLSEYFNDAVTILQMLSDFIKTLIESVSMACCSMKTFPITTGQIIFTVFSHCRDSKCLYRSMWGSVENQLKDLFRNCHELQLTYLMILEKHFIFDLSENEEKEVLIEALNINLKIGEIVQSLDAKTMAEQWKAFTTISEKYSAFISDVNIFQDCTQVLCLLVKNDINTAFEENQDERIAMRSLKVASFTIKILLKICNIYKHSTRKDYADVIDLMFLIQGTHSNLVLSERSQFKNLAVIPSESLLKDLLSDDAFAKSLLNCDIEKIKNEDKLPGYVFTILTVMKYMTQGEKSKKITKPKLISWVYKILTYNDEFNISLQKSESDDSETQDLFQCLIVHTAALALTCNSEQFSLLEKCMIEAVLSTDCCNALFSANLWVVLARYTNPQLLFNQLIWLCTMFKNMEKHKMFHRSPQKVHLSYTINRLFEVMDVDDKMKICKQFRIHDSDNVCIWSVLGVNNLPEEMKCPAEEAVVQKLKAELQSFNCKASEGIFELINVINLASTCTFTNIRGIEDNIIKLWSKTCTRQFSIQELDNTTVWFFDYIQALVSLTEPMWQRIADRNNHLVKLVHLISSLIKQRCTEIKLLLIDILCRLASCDLHAKKLDLRLVEAFSYLTQDEDIVRNKLYIVLRNYRNEKNVDNIICSTEDTLKQVWFHIKAGQDATFVGRDLNSMNFKYCHKCIERDDTKNTVFSGLKKTTSGNFEFDIDNLFDNESDSEEPVSKKVKLNADDAEAIIIRLEADSTMLCQVKENVFTAEYCQRIQAVCDKLTNTIH